MKTLLTTFTTQEITTIISSLATAVVVILGGVGAMFVSMRTAQMHAKRDMAEQKTQLEEIHKSTNGNLGVLQKKLDDALLQIEALRVKISADEVKDIIQKKEIATLEGAKTPTQPLKP